MKEDAWKKLIVSTFGAVIFTYIVNVSTSVGALDEKTKANENLINLINERTINIEQKLDVLLNRIHSTQ